MIRQTQTRKGGLWARPYVSSLVAAAVCAVWITAGSPPAQAQFGPDTARVVTLTGRVSLERLGELWVLAAGQTVSAGQVVVTGPDGFAQLELADHSTIEVFPNARLLFRANRFNWRELLELYIGKVRLQIQHLTDGDSPYRVTTPTAVISIRGTVLDVVVGPTQETLVQVETGSVGVRHRLMPGREVIVESGQSLQVLPNVPLAAAAKATGALVAVGKIVKAAGETLARVQQTTGTGRSGGGSSPKGAPPSSGGGSASGGASSPPVSGSDSGSNETAPPPGEDKSGAPPGDAIP
ncbi:MAG: hypothetical protein A3H28_08845 [Acidobacteria bacterium RIFCSPLOWO2_02_FULL_61_28]|nr:MAG: hypothetical protein A3H28_08845 [Acidobacteria bacterium RIFCSPLOWO2_02_FULL_61_28]